MKNTSRLFVILCCLALICSLGGFYLCTTAPDNVFIGLSLSIIGPLAALYAMIPLSRHIYRQKEDRIKRLEEEVELLKKNIKRLEE